MLKKILLTAVIVVADQWTKYIALLYLHFNEPLAIFPGLHLTLIVNEGAAFGFLSEAGGWQRWFFLGIGLMMCLGMLILLARTQRKWVATGLSLMLAGAIGNACDRLKWGYVVDFIDFYVRSWHWPAFNVADMAITLGTLILLVCLKKTPS